MQAWPGACGGAGARSRALRPSSALWRHEFGPGSRLQSFLAGFLQICGTKMCQELVSSLFSPQKPQFPPPALPRADWEEEENFVWKPRVCPNWECCGCHLLQPNVSRCLVESSPFGSSCGVMGFMWHTLGRSQACGVGRTGPCSLPAMWMWLPAPCTSVMCSPWPSFHFKLQLCLRKLGISSSGP